MNHKNNISWKWIKWTSCVIVDLKYSLNVDRIRPPIMRTRNYAVLHPELAVTRLGRTVCAYDFFVFPVPMRRRRFGVYLPWTEHVLLRLWFMMLPMKRKIWADTRNICAIVAQWLKLAVVIPWIVTKSLTGLEHVFVP